MEHKRGYNLRSIFGVSLLVLLAICIYSGFEISHSRQVQVFTEKTEKLLNEATSNVVEVRSIMKSMLGMYYASDEFAGADIEAFASLLRQYSNSTHVQDVGMFEYIDSEFRSMYESWMHQQGSPDFRIRSLPSLPGAPTPASPHSHDFPIISTDSPVGDKQRMLGLNLASIAGFVDGINATVVSGRSFLVKTPENWPSSGNMLAVQPVYFGSSQPETEDERMELLAGGIWIAIDASQLLSTTGAESYELVELSASDKDELELTLEHNDLERDNSLDIKLAPLYMARLWKLGNSSLRITLVKQIGIPRKHITLIAGITFCILVFALMIFTVIVQWQISRNERMRSLRAINKERENAQRTLESISDAVIALNVDLNVVYLNPSALMFLKFSEEDIINQPLTRHMVLKSRVEESGSTHDLAYLINLLGDELKEFDVEIDLPHLVGNTVKMSVSRMPDGDGGYSGVILVLEDVSRERKLSSELEYRANHDALTGCYNRFYFDRHLAQLINDVGSSHREHALCYIDLDQFKVVNDTCGHSSGDRLLCELTDSIKLKLRSTDVLARLGGDEFGIIICDCDRDDAIKVANVIYDFFQHFVFEHEGDAFKVHASIGLVEINADNCDLKTVMSAADVACYTAKESGRNALVVYSDTDETVTQHRDEMNWLPRLTAALNEDKFELLVQAIATINPGGVKRAVVESIGSVQPVLATEKVTTQISHYEFLIRLQGNDGKLITPFAFIQAAERYDLMRSIDRWVIKNAIQTVKKYENRLSPDCVFSVNISGQSAADPSLLSYIEEQLNENNASAGRFWFEITETAAISHFTTAVTLIRGIQALGAKVALDDFGSGLSSFAYLRNLPVDVLKIDGQFVKDVHDSDVAREMVRAIDHVGKSMGIKTVAEFVEDEKILQILATIGVDYAQGYLIAKPCLLAEALAEDPLLKAS